MWSYSLLPPKFAGDRGSPARGHLPDPSRVASGRSGSHGGQGLMHRVGLATWFMSDLLHWLQSLVSLVRWRDRKDPRVSDRRG